MSREVKVINSILSSMPAKSVRNHYSSGYHSLSLSCSFFWVFFFKSLSFLSLVGKWESRTHHAQMFFLYGSGIDFCLFVYLRLFV